MPLIVHELDGAKRYLIDFELDTREFAAIGRFAVQWAYLEHAIFAYSREVCEIVEAPMPADVMSTAFKRRLSAFRLLIEEFGPETEKQRMKPIIGKIANLEDSRHRIVHGLWDWDRANPERIKASSFRPPHEFESALDASKIERLAKRVAEVNFAIRYPNGIAGVLGEWTDENGQVAYAGISRISRLGMRALQGQGLPDLDSAKLPRRKRPQSSSKD